MVKKYIVTEDSPITGKTSYTVIENPNESNPNPNPNPNPNVNEVKELIDYSKEMRRLDKKSFGNTNPSATKIKNYNVMPYSGRNTLRIIKERYLTSFLKQYLIIRR
jgi:hypothetical protein